MGVVLITDTTCEKCLRYHLCSEIVVVKNNIEKLLKIFDEEKYISKLNMHTHHLKMLNCKNFKSDTPADYDRKYITSRDCSKCDFVKKCINAADMDECAEFLMRLTMHDPYDFYLEWICSGYRKDDIKNGDC